MRYLDDSFFHTQHFEVPAIKLEGANWRLMLMDQSPSSAAEISGILRNAKGPQPESPPTVISKPSSRRKNYWWPKVCNEEGFAEAVQRATRSHATSANPSLSVVNGPFIHWRSWSRRKNRWSWRTSGVNWCRRRFSHKDGDLNTEAEDSFKETRAILPSALSEDEIRLLHESHH